MGQRVWPGGQAQEELGGSRARPTVGIHETFPQGHPKITGEYFERAQFLERILTKVGYDGSPFT